MGVRKLGAGSVPFHVDLQSLDPEKFHESHLRKEEVMRDERGEEGGGGRRGKVYTIWI